MTISIEKNTHSQDHTGLSAQMKWVKIGVRFAPVDGSKIFSMMDHIRLHQRMTILAKNGCEKNIAMLLGSTPVEIQFASEGRGH